MIGASVDMHVSGGYSWVSSPKWQRHINPENCIMWYDRSTNPKGSYCLSLTTVVEILGRQLDQPWEQELLNINHGYDEWAIAAIILGLNTLPLDLKLSIVDGGWCQVPLSLWHIVLKPKLTALRRCPWIKSVTSLDCPGYYLRKILNCAGRTKGVADWDKVLDTASDGMRIHFALGKNGGLNRQKWETLEDKILDNICGEVVSAVCDTGQIPTLQEWWDSRYGWCPSGSTSSKSKVAQIKEQDPDLDASERGNKKTVIEQRGSMYPWMILQTKPADWARGSTKMEPGMKLRDLEAHCDEAFIVSSFASLNCEKHMNVDGMVGKQTPADVGRWFAASNQMEANSSWLSMDYSAFNQGHEARSLSSIDRAMARAWESKTAYGKGVLERIVCSRWMEATHRNRFVQLADGWHRVFAGLWSGHRNTARDNTILHKTYSDMALYDARDILGVNLCPTYKAYCGDDEDMKFSSWVDSMLYYLIHRLHGHDLGPAKQMAGRTHEFLQRIVWPGVHTVRPMWAMLAQTASGNWYKDNYTWYGVAIQAVNNNCWEMHVRGMPLLWARRMAIATLNAQMRIPKPNKTWKQLEWWAFRHSEKGHPLWAGTPGARIDPPPIVSKTPPGHNVKRLASEAWLDKLEKMVDIKLNEKQKINYLRECAADSYSKMYVKKRLEEQETITDETWPERTSTISGVDLVSGEIPVLPVYRLVCDLTAQPGDRRPASKDEIASRFGMDIKFVNMVGGFQTVLSRMLPHNAAKYEEPAEVRIVDWSYYRADDAIVSWATNTQAVALRNPRRPMLVGLKKRCLLTIAPNLAGKTTYVRAQKRLKREVLEVDQDPLLNRLFHLGRGHEGSKSLGAMATARFAIWDRLTRGNLDEILTQRLLPSMLPTDAAEWNMVDIRIVDPGLAILQRRGIARGWSQEYVTARYSAWQHNTTQFVEELRRAGVSKEIRREATL